MEILGIIAAIVSSALGGTAIGATRYLAATLDPFTIGAVRFGGGFVVLLVVTVLLREKWPPKRDLPETAGLGLLFFGVFPVLFNTSMIYTTAARGALALSTLPVLTMAVGALFKIEALTFRKTAGVLIATGGVAASLGASLSSAPAGAWRGDVLMIAAALCMAFFNVGSRPFVARSSAVGFAAVGMGFGALFLILLALIRGNVIALAELDQAQQVAVVYLALVCGSLIFFLWAFALGRTSPTIVAVSVAVNPVTASIFGAALLDERTNLGDLAGLAAVISGIVLASVRPRKGKGNP